MLPTIRVGPGLSVHGSVIRKVYDDGRVALFTDRAASAAANILAAHATTPDAARAAGQMGAAAVIARRCRERAAHTAGVAAQLHRQLSAAAPELYRRPFGAGEPPR